MRKTIIIIIILHIESSNIFAIGLKDIFDFWNFGGRWSKPNVSINDKINADQKGDRINVCSLDKDPTLSCNDNNAPDNNTLVFFEKDILPKLEIRLAEGSLGWDFLASSKRRPGWISFSLNFLGGTLDINGLNNNTFIQGSGLIWGYGYTLTSERFQVGFKDTIFFFSPKYKVVNFQSEIIPLYITGKNDSGSHFYRENTMYMGTHTYTGISWIYPVGSISKPINFTLDFLIEDIENKYLIKNNNVSSNLKSLNIGFYIQKRF